MDVGRVYTEAEQGFMDGFAGVPGDAESVWASALRQKAMDSFRETGLPHRRMENWKYTDLRAAISQGFPPPHSGAAVEPGPDPFEGAGFHTLTFVNGLPAGDMPEIEGVSIMSLDEALRGEDQAIIDLLGLKPARGDNPILHLNTALMSFGCVIRIAPGAKLDTPVHIRSVIDDSASASYASRIGIVVGNGAKATLIESFGGGGTAAFQRNGVTQIHIGDDATFEHVRVETETDRAVHLSNVLVEIGARARYNAFGLAVGASLMRNDLSIRFKGEHANATVDGVFLKDGDQHHDTTMFVDHAVPNCTSRELFKSVLGGSARGVFQGKILVRPDAQKTDGAMSANAILLTETAEMDAKPELEIYADDVVCGHGATSSQLDDDLMFFLRARGIPEREAKALLILAFIGEALECIGNEHARDRLASITSDWIGRADI